MTPAVIERALREALTAHDAVIVLDPAKGYHFGTDPELSEIAKSIAARVPTVDVGLLARTLSEYGGYDPHSEFTPRRSRSHGGQAMTAPCEELQEAAEFALAALNDPDVLGNEARRRLRAVLLPRCPICWQGGVHTHDELVWAPNGWLEP